MRILNVQNFLLFTAIALCVQSLQPQATSLPDFAKILDSWDEKDIKQFLADRNIKYDIATPTEKSKFSIDELKKSAAAELGKLYDAGNKYESLLFDQADSLKDNLVDVKETVLGYVWPNYISEKVSKSYGYVTDQLQPSYSQQLTDWVFDTWSEAQLQTTLAKNKVSYKSNAKKDDLVKLAKKNYNKISSNSKASGRYPGDWLFDAWSTKDLQQWLHTHNVKMSKRLSEDRSYLLKQVRENIYPASVSLKDSKNDLFNSLNLEKHDSVLDQASGVKDEFVDKWSESQLNEWLTYHGVKVSNKAKHNKAELRKLVKENKASLKADIDEWIAYAKDKVSPVLDKVPSQDEAAEVVNDTFVLDVETWPKDRLKAFLTSRGISIPIFATKKDLVKLVKKYKSRRLLDFSKIKPDVLFEGWSTEQIKAWLESNKVEAEGYRDDLVKKAYDFYGHLQKENFYKEQAVDAANTAKDAAVEYSSKGKEFIDKLYDDYKEPVGDALNAASDKAYEAAVATKKHGADLYGYLSSWSNEDLQKYLESFGIKNTNGWSHEELYKKAKDNTQFYLNGDSYWFSKPAKKSVWSTGYWTDLIHSWF